MLGQMATPGRTTVRRARGSLSQDEILDAAIILVEQGGLAQLSMPEVARYLKSGVTSIYWYFRSKEALLQALADRVSREISLELPTMGGGPWDETLYEYFVDFRDLIKRRPIYREIFAYRVNLAFERATSGPSVLGRLEENLVFLTAAGVTVDEAMDAINVCATYTRGFVILEQGAQEASGMSGELSDDQSEQFPLLSQVGLNRISDVSERQFDRGLRLLIKGIRDEVDDRRRAGSPQASLPD
jgi:AcrR family transcriptional regulator